MSSVAKLFTLSTSEAEEEGDSPNKSNDGKHVRPTKRTDECLTSHLPPANGQFSVCCDRSEKQKMRDQLIDKQTEARHSDEMDMEKTH